MTPHRHPSPSLRQIELRLVPTPHPILVLACVLGGLFLSALLALGFVPWQQSVFGQGRVVAYAPLERQQTVEAPIEGRIMRWHVREGSRVRAGDPLVDISDNDPEILARLREERDALQARVVAARVRAASIEGRMGSLGESRRAALGAAEQRVRMARDRVRAAEEGVRAAEAAVSTARVNHERQEALHKGGLASRRTMELAELDMVRTRTEAERARAALQAARSEEQALASDRARVGTDGLASIDDARAQQAAALAEVASASAEMARIEVRLARQRAQAVTAPRDGTVLRLLAAQGGEMVKAGDALAVLVPDTESRAVELWVSGNDVPLLSEGRHVRLQFEGWPALQFSGWPSVAVGTFGGQVALIDASDDGKGRFRVVIVPEGPGGEEWPSGRYLRQGTRAQGWVLLGQVRLGYELWRRFNGFPPMLGAHATDGAAKDGAKGPGNDKEGK
ncbi:MAG TPA: HlyD family efflux transporter periplasmic adaptor subunit [Polyangia bacterium]|nr:HlyD family efflux transporter periplasmic adaptor subunit [Polyangia bacterium]